MMGFHGRRKIASSRDLVADGVRRRAQLYRTRVDIMHRGVIHGMKGSKFSVDSVGRGTKGAGAPNPVSPLNRGGLATVSSFLAVGAGPAGGAVPNHEQRRCLGTGGGGGPITGRFDGWCEYWGSR